MLFNKSDGDNMRNRLVVLLLSVISLLSPFTASVSSATALVNLSENNSSNFTINDFNANVTSGYAPLDIQFKSNITGNATNYLWIIRTPDKYYYSRHPETENFTIITPGTYTASLIVLGTDGYASITKKDYITVNAPLSRANFTATQDPDYPWTVYFRGSVSNGTASKYVWYFGDGTKGVGKDVVHIYDRTGLYPIVEEVYLNNGTIVTETKGLILTK